MTRSEKTTMAAVAGCLLLASLVRTGWEARMPPATIPSDTTGIGALVEAAEEAVEEEERRRTPLAPGERVDPNRAPEVELARLPGLGPALAARVVAHRDETPFRRPEDLERVAGIGPATVERIAPHLDLDDPPPAPTARGPAPPGSGLPGGSAGVDVNRASEEELQELPGIGPAIAARILQFRRGRTVIEDPEELLDVPGIGPATLERIRPYIEIRRRR